MLTDAGETLIRTSDSRVDPRAAKRTSFDMTHRRVDPQA